MSKRVFVLSVGLVLLASGLAFTDWALSLRPGVTEANVRRIRLGMMLEEVEVILGGSAHRTMRYSGPVPWAPKCRAFLIWGGEKGAALIRLDAEHCVTEARFAGGPEGEVWCSTLPKTPAKPGLLVHLRAWLGW
jgi:hypothetical protein